MTARCMACGRPLRGREVDEYRHAANVRHLLLGCAVFPFTVGLGAGLGIALATGWPR